MEGGGTKTCPDCAESLPANARICRYCGYRSDAWLADDMPSAPMQPANPPRSAEASTSEGVGKESQDKPASSKGGGCGCGTLLILILIVAAILYFGFGVGRSTNHPDPLRASCGQVAAGGYPHATEKAQTATVRALEARYPSASADPGSPVILAATLDAVCHGKPASFLPEPRVEQMASAAASSGGDFVAALGARMLALAPRKDGNSTPTSSTIAPQSSTQVPCVINTFGATLCGQSASDYCLLVLTHAPPGDVIDTNTCDRVIKQEEQATGQPTSP